MQHLPSQLWCAVRVVAVLTVSTVFPDTFKYTTWLGIWLVEGILRPLQVVTASANSKVMHGQTASLRTGQGHMPECTHTCASCEGIMASDLRAAASALLSASAMGCRAGATLGCCTPLVNPGSGPAGVQLLASNGL